MLRFIMHSFGSGTVHRHHAASEKTGSKVPPKDKQSRNNGNS
jgi:hypothetical protein